LNRQQDEFFVDIAAVYLYLNCLISVTCALFCRWRTTAEADF